jgi:sulfur-oxidizing protein SoxB
MTRKEFLKKIGAASIGLGLAPVASFALGGNTGYAEEMSGSRAVRSGKAMHVSLLHTSDIHGQVHVHDEFFWEEGKAVFRKRGGFAHLKTLIKELKKQNPNSLLLDGGDCFQGSAIAALSEGQVMVGLMNDLQYDLVLPGNWEVVYGKKMLIKDMNGYTARKVCSNMLHDATDKLIFPATQVFSLGGMKIGFVGYNDPLTPTRQPPAFSSGIKFLQPKNNIAENVRHLREQEKCDLIFALTHMGMAQQLFLADQPYAEGIDYILGADTHERIRKPIQGKYSKVTEPGSFSSFIGKLDLVFENGKIKAESYELLEVDPEKYPADKEMLRLIDKAQQPYEKNIKTVIGKTKTPLCRYYVMETPMDNLITDAIMWKAKPDIALSSGFRFCPPLVPRQGDTETEITREFLWSMLPVDSQIRFAEITGQQLNDWLEQELENVFATDPTRRFGGWLVRFQGMNIKFTINNEQGQRLQKVTVKGEQLDVKRTYKIASCERPGDPASVLCRIKQVTNPHNAGYSMHSVMEEYLAEHSPVSPKLEGRAQATDAPPTLLSQVSGVNYQFR